MSQLNNFKWICCVITATVLLHFPGFSLAQEIEFGSSPNPVGSGARALGMGGAFIAVADDATAASWNPGGLIQLELPEISIVGAGFTRSEDNTFANHPESNGKQDVTEFDLNYLSAAYPFTLVDRNMIVAVTYQYLYDFTRSWEYNYSFSDGYAYMDYMVDFNQEGGLSAIGLSYAVQIVPSVSFGVTLNIWDDDIAPNSWTQDYSFTGSGVVNISQSMGIHAAGTQIHTYSIKGVNYNVGFLWRTTESLTIGAVYKAPFAADVSHDVVDNYKYTYSGGLGSTAVEDSYQYSYDEEMDMPASYGIGFAYRFSDEFTAAFDVYRTEWEDMIYTDYQGVKKSAISRVEESQSEISSTIQLRTGAEYLIIKPKYLIPLRAGLFYDPGPSEDGNDDYFGITLGSGFAWKQFIFDVGYQFRFGNDVGSAVVKLDDFSQDVREHTLYASLIVHF